MSESNTFCILPWMHLATNASGNLRVCCNSTPGKNFIVKPDGNDSPSSVTFPETSVRSWPFEPQPTTNNKEQEKTAMSNVLDNRVFIKLCASFVEVG